MKMINNFVRLQLFTSSSSFRRLSTLQRLSLLNDPSSSSSSSGFPYKTTSITSPPPCSSSATFRFLKTSSSKDSVDNKDDPSSVFANKENEDRNVRNGYEEGGTSDGWEDEDETEPEYGDGGDGGGVVLNGLPWGEQALSIAHEVLSQFGDDIQIFAFKTSPRGYVYVRLDKLSHKYGCPSMDELERYNREYKKRLDEVGALGEIPEDLGLDVSTPGAMRLLKVPDDLERFKDMPMQVCYIEGEEPNCLEKNGVFLLESLETEGCIWRLANVKENRGPLRKGRPLSQKREGLEIRAFIWFA